MNYGPKCTALVKSFEDCKLRAYYDLGGKPTIAWGHTRDVKITDSCSQTQADKWLAEELAEAAQIIDNNSTVPLTQGQFDALTSFGYNLGWPVLLNSTLWRKLMAGDAEDAANEFPRWCHVKKVEVAGLKRRRYAEQQLFKGASV